MSQVTRGWRHLLIGLLPIGLVLTACSSAASAPNRAGGVEPQAVTTTAMSIQMPAMAAPEDTTTFFIVNVDMTDTGYQPASIFIPQGRRVLLVLRNRGTTEHHYRVLGLMPTNLLWLTEPAGAIEAGVSAEDHELHHSGDFVPWRDRSPAGIKPMGFEVHGYAVEGGVDEVVFTPTNAGTFVVQDPLHPEIAGKVTIF